MQGIKGDTLWSIGSWSSFQNFAPSALTFLLGSAYKLKPPATRVKSAAEKAKDEVKA